MKFLPKTFLTNQKSKAFNITTIIKIKVSEKQKSKKKKHTTNALNNSVNK